MTELERAQRLLADGILLMKDAIDCPFTDDRARWEAWCADWRKRAETWIEEVRSR